MSHCGLGLSCEPDNGALSRCAHGVEIELSCKECRIEHRLYLLESKVKELESEIKRFKSFDDSNNMILSNLLNSKKELEKTLEKLEKEQFNIKSSVKVHWNDRSYFYRKIEELESKVDNKSDKVDKVPFKCPVCEGCGNDIHYNGIKKCPVCEGKGIVWS